MHEEIAKIYGERLRIRVCGLLFDDEQLLLVNHHGLNTGDFWAPPGGGIEYGEPIDLALTREFVEETGLSIAVHQFAFGCELIREPLHAIELFFWVQRTAGHLIPGHDPEVQIISGSRFFHPGDLQTMDTATLHGILQIARSKQDFQQLTGFYRI